MVCQIPLTQGKVALVDDEDFEELSRYSWSLFERKRKTMSSVFYAKRSAWDRTEKRYFTLFMHRAILKCPEPVDHKDGDGLHNCRSNLRPADSSKNQANRREQPGGSSRFRGVSWSRTRGKWFVSIGVRGYRHYLGYFTDEEAAAMAYDRAALKYFGEFSRLNFPEQK